VTANHTSFELPIAAKEKGNKNTENAINSKLQSLGSFNPTLYKSQKS